MNGALARLKSSRRSGSPVGITSVCSAHPLVIRAAARSAARRGETMLVEATCNQVNQFGGYTGMQPADFVALVAGIAAEEGLPTDAIFLGGDHLGPNPWRSEAAEAALAKAGDMVEAYVVAGFRKIHLDASMGCKGEPAALDDETVAKRAAGLAKRAESAARRAGGELPVYVIGTEVPPPGGADHVISTLDPTDPQAARRTLEVHREIFAAEGLGDALDRVIALVVQPGAEFGNENVVAYDRDKARSLSRMLDEVPGIVFEAHSTDYQSPQGLRALVEDGYPILKVGPQLTFALREALYGLDLIATDLLADYGERRLYHAMEALMLRDPSQWRGHYRGSEADQRLQRHYSFSDRIRYYWNQPEADAAVATLTHALEGRSGPLPLFSQHLPHFARFAGAALDPQALLIAAVERCLDDYAFACGAEENA